MTDRIITTEEAAQMLGASEATVRRYIDKQLIKGERIGVSEAIEFITQKEEELILPAEVADEFRKIVKRYTTKR